jgi:hypothetical protein
MVKLTVLYGSPDDPDAFEEYYANTHMPLVEKCPSFRGTRRPGSALRQTVASCYTTEQRTLLGRGILAPKPPRAAFECSEPGWAGRLPLRTSENRYEEKFVERRKREVPEGGHLPHSPGPNASASGAGHRTFSTECKH